MEELEAATSSYQEALGATVIQWLMARGIGRAEAATSRVGVVKDPFPGHERFTNFLSIPYLDKDSGVLSLRFRCLQEHEHRSFGHGKYMSMKEEPARTYNVGSIWRAKDEIHIAEGEFDAIVLTKVGFPAIAIPGASGWSPHHNRMVAGFSKVYVWGDPDEAGAEFSNKIAHSVRNAQAVRLTKADGDVSELYKKGSAQALHDRKNGKV